MVPYPTLLVADRSFLLGQGIYLIGTLMCILFTHNIWILVLGRLLQGLGSGSASVLGRSVLRDCYDGRELTKALSYVSVTASIMPVLAPVLGGWIAFILVGRLCLYLC